MAKSQPAQADRLTLKTKLAFGIGSGAEYIVVYSVSTFVLLYYNQVLGLPAHLASIAISMSLVLDGIVEPVVGSLSDRTRSRLGRRHPYMFAAAIPIALSFYAVFNPPDGLSPTALFWWLSITIIFLRQCMAFFHTPHLALGGELSLHYTERSKVMAYNSFFTWAGSAISSWVALSYFFKATPEHPRGLLNPEPWSDFALTMALAVMTILFASAWFTRDRIPFLPKPLPDAAGFSPAEFIRDMGRAFTNMNYVWLLIGYFFLSVMIGLRQGLHLYTNTFYWGLSSEQLRFLIVGTVVGFATAFFVAPRLHGRFDKKRTMIVSAIFYAAVPAIPIVLGLAGVLKPDTPGLLVILVAFASLGYGASAVLSISVMSALADIADENELKHGVRQEGVLYSTRTLFAKVDQAIGVALSGLVLWLIAFPQKAKLGAIPTDVLGNLALWDGVIAAVPGLLAVLFYARYRITRSSYEATRKTLTERRAAATAAASTPGPSPDGVPAPAV